MIFGTIVWNYDISRNFFHFVKILIFWVVSGKKFDKKFCQLGSISQEQYIIRFSFMVHMCKITTSPDVLFFFFIFSRFWFSRLLGDKRVKSGPQWEKITHLCISLSAPQNFLLAFIDELWKTWKIRILKKWIKKLLEISSFYTYVPKATIIWSTVPEIRS